MLKRLIQSFASPKQPPSPPAHKREVVAEPRRPLPQGTPVYPPVDQGIWVESVEQILETQRDLIRRIRLLAGTSDEEFNHRYLAVIRRLAHYIQLLPASESETHNGAGGLFRLCLEIAFFSSQSAEGVIFSGRGTAEDRRREEPRWRYAAFLAGINCELHRCITGMSVVDPKGSVWPAFNTPLTDWATSNGSDRYFVRWTHAIAGMATSSLLVERIASSQNLQYLHDGSQRIVPALMDVVAGVRGHEKSMLAEIIEQTRTKVLNRDKGVQPSNYGRFSVGSHLEPHLIDAMRQLIKSGKWEINKRKSRLWYAKSGLYLVWRMAAKEMLEILAKNQVSGIPQDMQTLLEILVASKVFINDKDGAPYWMIIPPEEKTEIVAVKFANPMTLFGAELDEVQPIASLEGGAQDDGTGQSKAAVTSTASSGATPKPQSGAGTPVRPVTPPHSPGAPIPEQVEETEPALKVPKEVAATLRPAIREAVNTLLSEYRTGKAKDSFCQVDHGMAIELEYLASLGISLDEVVKNLNEAGWLYTPPEKPSKKLHQVVMNGKTTNSIIIKSAQALDIGLLER